MMFMSTLTKKSRLRPHLVAEKAKEKKRNFQFLLIKGHLIYLWRCNQYTFKYFILFSN